MVSIVGRYFSGFSDLKYSNKSTFQYKIFEKKKKSSKFGQDLYIWTRPLQPVVEILSEGKTGHYFVPNNFEIIQHSLISQDSES